MSAYTPTSQRVADGVTLSTRIHKGRGIVELSADSLGNLVRYLHSPEGKPKGAYEPNPSSRSHESTEKWDLKAGWDGAVKFAAEGWPAGRRLFAKALASLPQANGFALIHEDDVAGGVLDCAAFVAGDPCHYDCDPEDAFGQTRLVRLVVPLTSPWFVNAEQLRNRGAAIASVVDAIESRGFQCEIDALDVFGGAHGQVVVRHRVKSAGEPLNLDFVATSLAHPATARRIGFAGLESVGGLSVGQFHTDNLRHGYGSAEPLHTADLEPVGTVLFPDFARGGDYSSPQAARNTIHKVFEKAGYRVDYADAE